MKPRLRIDASSRMPLESLPPEPPQRPAPTPAAYVELEARTNFSFLQGGSSPEVMVSRAAALGFDAIGICDKDGLYGMVRALEEAERQKIRLVVGCELTVRAEPPHASAWVYVENAQGYANLCRILTQSHALHPKGQARRPDEGVSKNCYAGVGLEFVCAHAQGLWMLAAPEGLQDAELKQLKDAFGTRLRWRVFRHWDGGERQREARVRWAMAHFGVAACATNAVRYAHPEHKPIFDVLHCIREGVTLDAAGRALALNAEARLKSFQEMQRVFADEPQWLSEGRTVADACRFSLRELKYRFPSELESQDANPDAALRRLTYARGAARYPKGIPESVRAQVEKELALIATENVAPFFLSVLSIVDMARRRDILCQGRGSAANSAVCFCLGITAVDPARSNLLFERFLSAERHEPPDIDVDFEHERREEVIQDIYARYGRDRAAMVSEVVSYRGKSALREVGKAFGLSLEQVDRLSALVSWWDAVHGISDDRLRTAGFDAKDARLGQVLALAHAIQGYPRHLSVHVGGFVLSAAPLFEVAPVEPATMEGRTVVPWDKDDLDTLGFFKVDVLGLGILSAIRRALALAQNDPRIRAESAIERLARIPPEDPAVYAQLCKGDSVGVFQVESRAQMAMLPRLRPERFYDLVVEVAIVRPGPIQGGMVHPYLRRRMGEEPVDSPHPLLEPILRRTLGVPIFQEQVMQLAIVGAGYSGGEADQLRRDMAAWRKNGNLERHRDRLTEGFLARGIPRDFAERLYSQMQGFGEYGFPESHAASFALLVYVSAWLRCHHPAAFAAALINSQPMGFYSPSTILQDAQRHGVEVRPISIDQSDWDCTLECGATSPALRVGLRQVKGLGEDAARRIEAERRLRAFGHMEDLSARAVLSRRELSALSEAGAFEVWGLSRRSALWNVAAPRATGVLAGLPWEKTQPALPSLTRVEQLSLDYSRTGFSVNDHPMRVLRPKLGKRFVSSREIQVASHGMRVETGGLVICRQRPQTASGVVFFTLEDEWGFINLVLWAQVFERLRHVATTQSLVHVRGSVERQSDVIHVLVQTMAPLGQEASAGLVSMSRDFH
ncbi:MAG: error-prone DNA polymerase [Myxococcaceae bacterium]